MSGPRIGELFAGYGGLGLGVKAALGGEVVWVSDIDKGARKILAHRFPGVPNIGDITTVDWSQVEPVDILTGGSPCQDLSHAGRRAGMTEGTRSNLWVAMREAIAQLRPRIVVWENVRGAYSAAADSALESEPGLLDRVRRRDGEPVLRALGRVLGDLSDLGYVGGWHGLRAADVGAPHGRFRVFVVAADAQRGGRHGWSPESLGEPFRGTTAAGSGKGSLLPTPRATDGTKGGPNQRGSSGDLMLPSAVTLLPTPDANADKYRINGDSQQSRSLAGMARREEILLPTPAVNDMGEGKTPDRWDEWTADMQAKHGNGNGHGKSLAIEAQRLLPTPRASDGPDSSCHARSWSGTDRNLHNVAREQSWGQYADAIARWEALTRPAPAPTQPSKKGTPQLSPAFVEWLMGLPAGHVTAVPGLSRNDQLKALGNGVVWQQAEAAIRWLLARIEAAA